MKLFTHQSKDFIISLLKEGFVKNNGNVMRNEEHIKFAYRKLVDYARDNISTEFICFPIWCWHKIESANENDGIKIELDVPDNLVLLMDYYDWGGGVLYYSELLYNGEEAKEDMLNQFNKNFSNCVNSDMLRADIQGIIPYIKLEWVKNKAVLDAMIKEQH